MESSKFDKVWVGIVIGIFGAILGFLIFGIIWAQVNNTDFNFFVEEIFLGMSFYQDKIVTISMLVDVILFALFLKFQYYRICKGLVAVMLISVPVIIYLY